MSRKNNPPCLVESLDPRRLCAAGLTATYYAGANFDDASVARTDATLAFNWGKHAPAGEIPSKHFSARWTATLTPADSGRSAIYVTTEGGVRVWIGDQLMLDRWKAPGESTNYKFITTLTPGEATPILVEYRHDGGRGQMGVSWLQPGGAKQALGTSNTATRPATLNDAIDHAGVFARGQLKATFESQRTKNGSPSTSDPADPDWTTVPFTDWTSGTFAGALWEIDRAFPTAGFDALATEWTTPLANVHVNNDVFDREWAAFKPYYDATGSAAAKKVLLASAALKYKAYSKTVRAFLTPGLVSTSGKKNADFGVLMDQTNDMAELLWAGKTVGDPSYQDRVLAHMHTVAATMVRTDGSVVQRGYFDSKTGQFVVGENYQGYSNTSTWSRAQAWAMNSFSTVAKETGDGSMLATAEKAADYFISHTPADGVPYWDFASPKIPHTFRDTSAAAVASEALVRLSTLTTGAASAKYKAAAEKILTSLLSPKYLAEGTASQGVLQHAAYNVPKNRAPDVSLMFGDYAVLQAVNDYTALGTTRV